MKTVDVFKDVLESEAMHLFLDQIVVSKLKESLSFVVEERERLDKIAEKGELMLPHQQEDWNCLVQDIVAFNRLIDYYGG
jgi:hypothetical protein